MNIRICYTYTLYLGSYFWGRKTTAESRKHNILPTTERVVEHGGSLINCIVGTHSTQCIYANCWNFGKQFVCELLSVIVLKDIVRKSHPAKTILYDDDDVTTLANIYYEYVTVILSSVVVHSHCRCRRRHHHVFVGKVVRTRNTADSSK